MEDQVTRSELEVLKKQIELLDRKLEAIEIRENKEVNKLQPSSSKSYGLEDSTSVMNNIGVNGPYSGNFVIDMEDSQVDDRRG